MDTKNKIEKLRGTINKIDKEQRKDDAAAMWEETLPVLLDSVDEKDVKLMTSVLQSQWDYIQDCKYNWSEGAASAYEYEGRDISSLIVPTVRRIYDDFPIKKLVGVQPITELVDKVYTLEYSSEEVETTDSIFGTQTHTKMTLNVNQHTVEAGARKLNACWTPAKKTELVHCYGLDLECEKIQALSQEIRADITNEVLIDLKKIGGEPEVVIYKGKNQADRDESLKLLGCRIRSNCSAIAMTTRRGHGNWIVVSKAMAMALSKLSESEIEIKDDYKSKTSEMLDVGTLNYGISVFVANVPDDEILIGYKGTNGEVDTGYIYCPHTAMLTGGMCVHPTTFEPVLPFMTRYGKFVTEKVDAYYRNIKVESDLITKK